MTGDVVTVFNRAPMALVVTKDGREYVLEPGPNHITRDLVLYAKQQHPMPGTEDPSTLAYESFISYVADPRKGEVQRDLLDPVPQAVWDVLPKERLNRALLPQDRQNGTSEPAPFFPRGRVGFEQPTDGITDPGKF